MAVNEKRKDARYRFRIFRQGTDRTRLGGR
jgi:hypothetical protein